jgi:hypothetical protein
MTKKPATKRIRIKLGDVFALPFEDGSFGVAQIGAIAFSVPTYVVFDARFRQVDEIARNLDAALSKPVTSVFVTGSIRAVDGIWPRVASRPPQAGLPIPVFTVEVGVSSYSDGIVTSIASTYTGAKQIMDPGFLQQFLLPGVPLPSTAADASSTAPARAPSPPEPAPSTESPTPPSGRARAEITIPYPGGGLPSVDIVRRRQALGHAIEGERLGEVTDAGGGGGIVEMSLEVRDAATVHSRLLELAREHGFPDARIAYEPNEPS